MSKIVRDFQALPDRIRSTLATHGYGAQAFVLALKTAFKPSATIPILWFVVMRDAVLLCNTHRDRGLWRTLGGDAAIRIATTSIGQPYIELGAYGEDRSVYVTLADGTTTEDLDELMREIGRARGST
jgi:hypothetical protein